MTVINARSLPVKSSMAEAVHAGSRGENRKRENILSLSLRTPVRSWVFWKRKKRLQLNRHNEFLDQQVLSRRFFVFNQKAKFDLRMIYYEQT